MPYGYFRFWLLFCLRLHQYTNSIRFHLVEVLLIFKNIFQCCRKGPRNKESIVVIGSGSVCWHSSQLPAHCAADLTKASSTPGAAVLGRARCPYIVWFQGYLSRGSATVVEASRGSEALGLPRASPLDAHPLLSLPGRSSQCWNTLLSSSATVKLVVINLPAGYCLMYLFQWGWAAIFQDTGSPVCHLFV